MGSHAFPQERVPHLRDGVIVAKVGIERSETALTPPKNKNAPPRRKSIATKMGVSQQTYFLNSIFGHITCTPMLVSTSCVMSTSHAVEISE